MAPVRTETGPDGTFTVSGLAGKTFTMRVQAPGFAPFEVQDVGTGAALKVRLARAWRWRGASWTPPPASRSPG
jgi:hypothetical protein